MNNEMVQSFNHLNSEIQVLKRDVMVMRDDIVLRVRSCPLDGNTVVNGRDIGWPFDITIQTQATSRHWVVSIQTDGDAIKQRLFSHLRERMVSFSRTLLTRKQHTLFWGGEHCTCTCDDIGLADPKFKFVDDYLINAYITKFSYGSNIVKTVVRRKTTHMYIALDDETYYDDMLMDTIDVLARLGVKSYDIQHVNTISLISTYVPLYPSVLFSHIAANHSNMSKAIATAVEHVQDVTDACKYFTQPYFEGLMDTDELIYQIQKNHTYK